MSDVDSPSVVLAEVGSDTVRPAPMYIEVNPSHASPFVDGASVVVVAVTGGLVPGTCAPAAVAPVSAVGDGASAIVVASETEADDKASVPRPDGFESGAHAAKRPLAKPAIASRRTRT